MIIVANLNGGNNGGIAIGTRIGGNTGKGGSLIRYSSKERGTGDGRTLAEVGIVGNLYCIGSRTALNGNMIRLVIWKIGIDDKVG